METLTKREFIKKGLLCTGGLFCAGKAFGINSFNSEGGLWKWSREAYFYSVTPRGVKCGICPNGCTLRPGETSECNNRINYNDKLYSISYGNPCAVHVDPIEKKPLFHFLPKTYAYSIATAGCNFACLNCQNWEISQTSPKKTRNIDLMPEKVVAECIKNNCTSAFLAKHFFLPPFKHFHKYQFNPA